MLMADSRSDSEVILGPLTAPDEFGAVFERYWDSLYRYFERRLGEDVAADLASEVFRIAFERRDSFKGEPGRGWLPWLYGIAANLVLKERRRFARHLKAMQRFEIETGQGNDSLADHVSGSLDAETTWARLREAILSLDETAREMLLLLAWEELSYRELAEAFDIPVGTVRSRIHRARAALRSHLDAESGGLSGVEDVEEEVRDGR